MNKTHIDLIIYLTATKNDFIKIFNEIKKREYKFLDRQIDDGYFQIIIQPEHNIEFIEFLYKEKILTLEEQNAMYDLKSKTMLISYQGSCIISNNKLIFGEIDE